MGKGCALMKGVRLWPAKILVTFVLVIIFDWGGGKKIDIPGSFWFVPHGINEPEITLHSSAFKFDDSIIDPTSKLWMKLFELRLNN
jgi:hypothetical protein